MHTLARNLPGCPQGALARKVDLSRAELSSRIADHHAVGWNVIEHDGTHADEASASDCARFSYGAGLPQVAANFHVDVACQDNAAGDGDMIFDDVVVIDHRSAQAKEKIT